MHFLFIALKRIQNTAEFDAAQCEYNVSILLSTLIVILFKSLHINVISKNIIVNT